jgi:hypothetical protein
MAIGIGIIHAAPLRGGANKGGVVLVVVARAVEDGAAAAVATSLPLSLPAVLFVVVVLVSALALAAVVDGEGVGADDMALPLPS